jgi:DNA-binding NarL/FixJ family response regulator
MNILALTESGQKALPIKILEAGAVQCLEKNISEDELIARTWLVARGMIQEDPDQVELAERWQEEVGKKRENLSKREAEILKRIAWGATNKLIASELSIKERTVENHVAHILKKLGLNSRQQALMWMRDHFPEEARRE